MLLLLLLFTRQYPTSFSSSSRYRVKKERERERENLVYTSVNKSVMRETMSNSNNNNLDNNNNINNNADNNIDSLLRQLFPCRENVLIYGPEDFVDDNGGSHDILIPELLDRRQGHFSNRRVCIMFKPGVYKNINCPVGYWTHVLGLGQIPSDVKFTGQLGVYALPANTDNPNVGSLDTFWRAAEHFSTECEFLPNDKGQYCAPLLDRQLYPVSTMSNHSNDDDDESSSSKYGMLWSCSQAAPLRRVCVNKGNLYLSLGDCCASGGFIANTSIQKGCIMLGSQQQYCIRNCYTKQKEAVVGGAWSFVLVGCDSGGDDDDSRSESNDTSPRPPQNQQQQKEEDNQQSSNRIKSTKKNDDDQQSSQQSQSESSSSSSPQEPPYISYQSTTPIRIEKPYLYIDDNKLYLGIPQIQTSSVGIDHTQVTSSIQITNQPHCQVQVFTTQSQFTDIQNALDRGCHIVLNPGIYTWNQKLVISQPNTVILGIGMTTIQAPLDGDPCIHILGNQGGCGVRISGLSLEASTITTYRNSTLLQWGGDSTDEKEKEEEEDIDANNDVENTTTATMMNPGVIHDLYCFVGGRSLDRNVQVETMVKIYSDNVVGDNLWLWRADHCILRDNEQPNKPHLSEYHVTEYGYVGC